MDIDSQMMKTASGEDFNMEVSEIQASVVNEVNELGETALFTAAKKGHLDVVKELLKYSNKETVTKKNKSRLDPLHIAASQGHHVRMMRCHPFEADAAIVMLLDKFGNTAPHVATRKKRAEVIIERYSRTDLPDIEKIALFNTKTHILRVFQRRKMLRIDGLCKKMGYKDAKLLMLYGGRSSINRYLQWKSGKVWSKSFSAGDDSCNSCSELEDGKSHERSGQETNQQLCNYKYQLEQEVKKLQQQLQEETDLHLALASAVEHCGSPSSSSPGKLPDKAQELLDSIAVLEITVANLEQEFVSLQCQISQERNERRLAEYHLKHLPFPSTSLFDSSLAYLTEPIARLCNEEEAEQNTDDMHLPEAFIDNNYIVDNLWHHPNQLSEEMVLRMRDIFIFLADSSKLSSSSSSSSVSPASPHCPLANFLASSSDSPVVTSFVSSPSGGGAYDPYGISDKVDWTFSIGTYSKAIEVSWLSVGKKELEYAAMALKRFRLLVEQLLRVDPSQMSSNEKLAFWVNLYNALIMHAYLAYGVPRNDIKLFSLMQKAAYTIGGLSVSAADIECTVLKMNPATYRPQIAAVFALQKFKASAELQKYTIDHPEPLLHFALSCGLHSSPAVRIFRPENMNESLKRSMQDYIQASVGISNKGKLLVPKLLHCFAKGMVEDSVLPDWICQFLSPQQASMVKNCLSRNKWRILGARVFSIIPFDSRFRFLFLLDDKSSQLSKSKV